MRLKLGLIAALVLSIGLTGCKSKEQLDADGAAKKGELDKLQGKWKVVSRMGDDEEDAEPTEAGAYYVIEGDLMKYVYKAADGKVEEYGRKFGARDDAEHLDEDDTREENTTIEAIVVA